MKVDRDQFMEQGYLVLRNVIPPDRLEAMRASCETILDRQKSVWASEREPDDPLGGEYGKVRQPRVHMERPGLIDEETANVVEDFWVADETLEIAGQLLCNPQPNVTTMMMMCNPVRDWPGGTGWHRDVHPVDMAADGRAGGGPDRERTQVHAVERADVRRQRAMGGAGQPPAAKHREGERRVHEGHARGDGGLERAAADRRRGHGGQAQRRGTAWSTATSSSTRGATTRRRSGGRSTAGTRYSGSTRRWALPRASRPRRGRSSRSSRGVARR